MKIIRSGILAVCAALAIASAGFAATLVDLNTASSKDLEALKGVGKVTANKIIAGRPYRSVDELSKAGLTAKQIAVLRPQVTVTAVAAAVPPAPRVAASARAPRSTAPSGPVDLNTASEKDLEALKGVGPATAKKIMAARPYASVDELTKAGVSARVIAEIRPFVTVGAAAAVAAPPVRPRVIPAPAPVPMATPAPAPAPTPAPAPAPAPVASAPATQHATSRTRAPKLAAGEVVNINTASKEMLEELPGIGPVKAQAIIDARPYATIEDIMKVKGIKQGEFAKIRNVIVVK